MDNVKSMYHDVPIGRLIDDAIEHLRNQGLSEATLTATRNVWLQVELYMKQRKYSVNPVFSLSLLRSTFATKKLCGISKSLNQSIPVTRVAV